MAHLCHATACVTPVPPERLMCLPHWRTVPREIQRRVWATYRPGQCDDMNPSPDYCRAARDAVVAVARCEGRAPDVRLYSLFLYRAKVCDVCAGDDGLGRCGECNRWVHGGCLGGHRC